MMKLMTTKLFIAMTIIMALAISLLAAPTELEEAELVEDGVVQGMTLSRLFLAKNKNSYRAILTCNKYPRVCRVKGSPGPDCCRKHCVNVAKDRSNCGMCGRKCKYYEVCCRGVCVNPLFNKRHCGRCNNRCKKGSSCQYGMCSYA